MLSLNNPPVQGVLPVLHTPFTKDGDIDADTLHREMDWAFEVGADGVVVAMVSEILRMGYYGRRDLAKLVCKAIQGRGFCIISVGAESTREACDFARHAEGHGASAVMAIPPVATRLGTGATKAYFTAIAESVSIPLVVQDASAYVGAA
ncbi:MAG: dihydrodipicolinate synthase family protein, partial [Gemmataceae bacterium]